MAYTTIDNPGLYFNTVVYAGSNSDQSVTGVGFQPDWVWIKNRSSTPDHMLNDAVRGAGKQINSNTTTAELDRTYFMSFDSDGFTLDGNVSDYNQNSSNFVGWSWKAGTTGSGSTGGSGTSKSYTYSANTTAGFSITRYTGNGTSGHTIPHNLGVTPQMIIIKSTELTQNWSIYHHELNSGTNPEVKYLELNSTNAQLDSASIFNDAPPTSSHFVLGNSDAVNTSNGVNIAYCFAEKKGYSRFGTYTGNGNADGTFVYTGFRPAWIMSKSYSNTESWIIKDATRDPVNPADTNLAANSANSESTWGTEYDIDILSNGFKMRDTAGQTNGNGYSFIYMAFAEHPFVTTGTKAAGTAR